LKAKAIEFYKSSYPDSNSPNDIKKEFTATNGWIYRFKRRHRLNLSQCSGDSFEIQKNITIIFWICFKKKFSQYGKDNIFNCDETALFYKLAPSKSLLTRVINGIKKYKERITVMLACNMS
ncbi:Tigger transposable element-derived protein 6, partial [Dictyocoela muelleri]